MNGCRLGLSFIANVFTICAMWHKLRSYWSLKKGDKAQAQLDNFTVIQCLMVAGICWYLLRQITTVAL